MPPGVGGGESGKEAEGDVGGLHLGGVVLVLVFVSMCARLQLSGQDVKRARVNFARGQANTVAGVERM
jgi:hypothetical protein